MISFFPRLPPRLFRRNDALHLEPLSRCLVILACVVVAACGDERGYVAENPNKDAETSSASGELSDGDMEAILLEIKATAESENEFFGDAFVRELRERRTQIDPRKEPGPYLHILMSLGNAEVDLGNLDAGIERLTEAYELLAVLDAPDTIRGHIIADLGNAYLRLAETENCCARHSPESCIVPLQGAAIHTVRRGSEAAIKYFAEVMQLPGADPDLKLKCVWLTNLAYMTLGEYPDKVPVGIRIPTKVFESSIRFPRFPNVAGELGLDRNNLAGGAVMDDFDGDGDLDLVTSSWHTAAPMSYHENLGNGTFRERSEAAGLSKMLGGLNVVQADYDNDGDLDLFVMRGAWLRAEGRHPNSLLQNQGQGVFVDRTFEAGLGEVHYPTQTAAWADYDNDGDLDLFVGNESDKSFSAPCQLFRNQGNGRFEDVAVEAGVTNDRYTKGVVWGDIDGDRWPDLVVSNLDGENRLYHNLGDGTFEDIAQEAGMTGPIRSFPAWTWDFDNDGCLDVFISSYTGRVHDFVRHYLGLESQIEVPGHYRGDGNGGFENVAAAQGLLQPMLPMGSNLGDLNNDGYLDFYLGTGEPDISVIVPNLMFLNQAGNRFVDVTMAGGFGHLQKGHAVVFADFDEDGDQDVFEQMGGAKPVDAYRDALFANPGFGQRWVKIRLVGIESNRSAIGARIHLQFREGSRERSVYRHIGSGGSFGSNPLRAHIGLGGAEEVDRLEIYWPTSDTRQVFENLALNQTIEVVEGEAMYRVRE